MNKQAKINHSRFNFVVLFLQNVDVVEIDRSINKKLLYVQERLAYS